jgi:hypothetical protein
MGVIMSLALAQVVTMSFFFKKFMDGRMLAGKREDTGRLWENVRDDQCVAIATGIAAVLLTAAYVCTRSCAYLDENKPRR